MGDGQRRVHDASIAQAHSCVVDKSGEQNPRPVVVGKARGGSCFGASYGLLFNVHHRIKTAGLTNVALVTRISAEPFLGHFGLGESAGRSRWVERFRDRNEIQALPDTAVKAVREIELGSGATLRFAYSMIVPPSST